MQLQRILNNRLFLSLAGGLLMSAAWWEHLPAVIMLVALVPFIHILNISSRLKVSSSLVFSSVFPGFLVFNILSFSWLTKASPAGGMMAIIAHSILLSLVFWLTYKISLKSGKITGALSLVSFWLAYEFTCLHIDIISPWLNSGNVFGKEAYLVQWYEFTGTAGGSLWIIISNIIVYELLSRISGKESYKLIMAAALAVILFPPIISLAVASHTPERTGRAGFVIVQPNIDPYTEKFDSIPFTKQFGRMLNDAGKFINEGTDWVLLPETAIDDPFPEESSPGNVYIKQAKEFLDMHPGVDLVFGATSLTSKKHPGKAKERGDTALHNSAVHLSSEGYPEFYHKSKLVPGIEKEIVILPYFLMRLIIPDLGGSMSGYTPQDEREVFIHSETGVKVAPIICYESAYGEFVTSYLQKGADVLAIITNDGWWDKTAGYKQHYWFASLRAIENRRPVIRCANTGISCICDINGKTLSSTGWWEKDILEGELSLVNYTSFYSKHGDYIYRFFTFSAVIIIILAFIAAPIRKLRFAG